MSAIFKSLLVSPKSLYKKLKKRWRASKRNEHYILDNLSISQELEDSIFTLLFLFVVVLLMIKGIFY